MAHVTTTDEKFRMMIGEPVERLVCLIAVPTIVSMLITSIYNMADTFFVSKISTSASGAVGVAFSLMAIIQAIGFTFGNGAGNYISRLLGEQNRPFAARVAATGFFSAFGLGVFLAVLGIIFLDPLVHALGATPTIAPYAKDYIRLILIGMPYMASAFVLNHILRYQGSPYHAMIGMGLGGLLNIVLDPIFIFTFGMGISGAALATIVSQLISFLILYFSCNRAGNIRIQLKKFTPSWPIFKEMFNLGLPSFYRQTLSSTAMICLNFASGSYGDAAVAAISIVARVFMFATSAVLGFCQGFQPVCGFNHGAKHYDRVLGAFWFTVKTAAIALAAMGVVGFLFAPHIIALFRKEDLDVITIGALALRYQCLALPLSAWIISTNMLLQTIGKGAQASLVSVSRQGLFFLPAILLLPHRFGLLGVQISQPIADIFSFLMAIVMTAGVLRELKSEQRKLSLCSNQADII